MAFRTWAKLLGATLGVAALAGASQLGVAYGLGILRLTRVLDVAARDQWTTQLAWVAWLAMMAAVLGGLAGGWLRDRWRAPAGTATFVGVSIAAGVGAAVVVPLTMQPARTAQIAGVHPVSVIGMCAALGALVGAIAAYAALTQQVARWSLSLVGLIVWVIALVSVAPSLAPSDPLPAVRLGVFDAGFLAPGVTQRTALFTMPAIALLAGAALGWAARRREMPTLTIALAGLPGAALLTLAYLIAGPGSGGERYQVVPYWAAMTATGAGVLGSVLAAVLRRGGELDDERDGGDPADRTAETSAATPRVPDQRLAPDRPDRPMEATDRPSGATAVTDRPAGAEDRSEAGNPWLGGDPDRPAPRRSSAADAFTSRTGEWAARRSDPPSASRPATSPAGIALGEYTRSEPEPFDAFRRPAAAVPQAPPPPAPEATRYVPAPALPPMPPEAIQEPPAQDLPADEHALPARGGGLRSRMPFGRNRGRAGDTGKATPPSGPTWPGRAPLREAPQGPGFSAPSVGPGAGSSTAPQGRGPLVPEPEAISAPLPHPEPITPPLPVTPAPDESRRGRKRRANEDEFVDWVNGLGGPDGPRPE
jgi:hypothetical protein